MRKKDICKEIVKNLRDVHGNKFYQDDINEIVTYVFNSIIMGLRVREKVIIRGFGRFEVKKRSVRKYYDMRSKTEAVAGEKEYIKFTQALNIDVNKLY